MKICTFHQSFTKRSKRDHPQGHRKGKGYHCSRPRHYNTDDDKTIWQRCQQCQKTSHHPNQGQYFDCSESQPSSLLSQCDNPQPSVIPAPQNALPGLGRVCRHSSQEMYLDKQWTEDGGGEIPQGQSKKSRRNISVTTRGGYSTSSPLKRNHHRVHWNTFPCWPGPSWSQTGASSFPDTWLAQGHVEGKVPSSALRNSWETVMVAQRAKHRIPEY